MPRLKTLHEGDNGWTEWIQPVMRRYKLACCGCGLTHDIDFKITRAHGRPVINLRAKRNLRSTAAIRRKKK